jgi:hypothetical protein
MTQKEFINHVLIDEIGDVVDHHKWLSFILLCSGIEFLGGCLDHEEKNLNAENRSAKRFNDAILKLFPSKYHSFIKKGKDCLYSQLRCGMNHVALPGLGIALSERNSNLGNLSEWNNRTIIIAEDFYSDFKNACQMVIKMIDEQKIVETFEIRC